MRSPAAPAQALLKGISTRADITPANWSLYLSERLRHRWRTGGESGQPPFAPQRGQEAGQYAALPTRDRWPALSDLQGLSKILYGGGAVSHPSGPQQCPTAAQASLCASKVDARMPALLPPKPSAHAQGAGAEGAVRCAAGPR